MKKTLLQAVAFVICLLTIQSCDEYWGFERDFRFNTNNDETVIGLSLKRTDFSNGEKVMLFETTATEDYLILSIPFCAINGNRSKSWIVYAADDELKPAQIESLKIVFRLKQGKFTGAGSEYTTSFDNFDAEIYAYDLWCGNTSHSLWHSETYYVYTIEVSDAELKLDTFSCKGGDCDKLICKGSFNISSELTIRNEKDEEVTRIPLNFSNGSFKCVPLSQVTE